jgi:predicted Zn-dependent protease
VTTERIADMQNRAYAVPYKQIPDSLDFHFVRAKLRADQGTSADAVLQARSQLKEGRYASEAGARYALVSALMRDRSLAAAEKEFVALKASSPPHPMIDMLEARLRTAQGDRRAAREILKAARARFPNSHAVSYALVDAYQATGQHREALKELDDLIQVNGRDPSLYAMRARSLDAVGDPLRVHQALAEEYYLRGSLPAAIEQLQIAQKSAKGDFYELSVLEARLRQLRGEMSDQAKLK